MTKTTQALFILLLTLAAGAASAITYISEPAGGDWNDAATWNPVGVPASGDDVIVASEVQLTADATCRDLTVQAGAWLHNNTTHRMLTVERDLVNDGEITDSNWTIQIFVAGDLTNSDVLAVNLVRFTGAGTPHTLTHTGAGTLMCDRLELDAGTGPVSLVGPLTTGADIDLNAGQMLCTAGADITLTGGVFEDGALDAAGRTLDLADGVYFWNVTVADPVFTGWPRVFSGCTFTGTVINHGVFQNRASTHADLVVDGDFENHGTVTSSNWTLDMDISGDVVNQGLWSNNLVRFTGAGLPHVLTSGGGTSFLPNSLDLEAGTGDLTLATPTTLGAQIDLNGGSLVCAPGSDLTILSGPVEDGVLDAAGNAVDVTSGVYLWNLQVIDPVFRGVVQTFAGVVLSGTVVVEGELTNRPSTHSDVIVDGDLINHGNIWSTNWTLDLDITGDAFNDGLWTSNTVRFTGVGAPHAISQTAGKSMVLTRFELEAASGPLNVQSPLTVGGIVDFNGGQVNCVPGADLTFLSDYVQAGSLDLAGNDLRLNSGTFLWSLQVDDPVLRGDVSVFAGVTMTGTVVVQDTLRNRANTHDDLIIDGDLINNGLITSSNYTLELFISGDAVNNGVWENYRTHFNGTDDQFILVDDAHPLGAEAVFVSHLNSSGYQWFNGSVGVPGATATTWNAGLLDASAHGQYRCTASGGATSRWLFVSPHFDTTDAPETSPRPYALEGNSPNPFNPKTAIAFSLPEASRVELAIHDLRGRRVRTLVRGQLGAGRHMVDWTGTDDADRQVAAGVYFSVLRSTQGTLTRKLTLLP